ncbi:MAG: cell division ATP-binding protein FtsE [Deinococcaceae bacterium]
MIQLHHVTLRYPGMPTPALSDINLHVKKGQFVYLIGQSGAGKSSLLSLLLKKEVPTEGEIYVASESLKRYRGRRVALHRRRIGMVFQDNLLLPQMNVFDNVAFALRINGLPVRQWNTQIESALAVMGLEDRQKHYPRQLSQGEKQRVAIARAMVSRPPLILLDEPTGNLDPENALEIVKMVQNVNLKGTTIVFATHAKDIVDTHKNRTVTLKKGRIIRDDPQGGYVL